MNTQMMICMVIFAATLVSYMMNKIPMWLTAMLSLTALYFTGCIDATGALAGFSNANTLLMATMFIVAAGFRRTSLVDGMCDAIMKLTRGSFLTAYFGYILIAVLLTNFIASPMVVYAIVSPLLAALCDNTGHSRTQYMFPVMVVCVACCGILPLSTAIQQAGQFTGFMETYGFTDMSIRAVDFTIGTWPILIIVPLWALFIGPKFTPKTPVVPIEALEKQKCWKTGAETQSGCRQDRNRNFLWYDLMPHFLQPVTSCYMVCCIDRKPSYGIVWCCRPESCAARHSVGYADAVCRRTGSGNSTDKYRCRRYDRKYPGISCWRNT